MLIKTSFKGPTDSSGSRVVASAESTRITFHYEHVISSQENHDRAAHLLAEKLGWYDAQALEHRSAWFKGDCYHMFSRKEI